MDHDLQYDLKPLAEQVVVITGASSGIGLATARLAAERGASVMLVARNGAALAEIVAGIVAAGGEAAYLAADVGDAAAVAAVARATLARFGRIDSWVSNAGSAIYARLTDTPLVEHERMFRTNYFGTVNCATEAVKALRTAGGALIVTGSIASDLPSPILGAYTASKHAVKGYVDSLRMELKADGVPISVTLIKPSGIDTPVAHHAAVHLDGGARVPPPAYDPASVAEAILDAAVHPRREVTVGGAGRLQTLFGLHFPETFDRLAGLLAAALVGKREPAVEDPALFTPGQGGSERSGDTPALRTSIYTLAQRHPGAVAAGVGAVLAAAAALTLRKRPTDPG